MAQLNYILDKVTTRSIKGKSVHQVVDLQIDSRKVTQGSCFIAISGSKADGHNYIGIAINNGASVIVCEQLPVTEEEGIQYIIV